MISRKLRGITLIALIIAAALVALAGAVAYQVRNRVMNSLEQKKAEETNKPSPSPTINPSASMPVSIAELNGKVVATPAPVPASGSLPQSGPASDLAICLAGGGIFWVAGSYLRSYRQLKSTARQIERK